MSVSLLLGLVYLISELPLTVSRRSRSRTGTKQDRSTLLVVWLVIMVSVAAGIYVARQLPAAALPHHRSFVVAGVVLFVAGLLLRWWAIITLGRFFTVDVTIEKDHELVERGPFRVVRHPSMEKCSGVFKLEIMNHEPGRLRRTRSHRRTPQTMKINTATAIIAPAPRLRMGLLRM
jgi:isoprenylcysteine carboxyl methyltransferase (ICMT) family protein YpbQ